MFGWCFDNPCCCNDLPHTDDFSGSLFPYFEPTSCGSFEAPPRVQISGGRLQRIKTGPVVLPVCIPAGEDRVITVEAKLYPNDAQAGVLAIFIDQHAYFGMSRQVLPSLLLNLRKADTQVTNFGCTLSGVNSIASTTYASGDTLSIVMTENSPNWDVSYKKNGVEQVAASSLSSGMASVLWVGFHGSRYGDYDDFSVTIA